MYQYAELEPVLQGACIVSFKINSNQHYAHTAQQVPIRYNMLNHMTRFMRLLSSAKQISIVWQTYISNFAFQAFCHHDKHCLTNLVNFKNFCLSVCVMTKPTNTVCKTSNVCQIMLVCLTRALE